MEGKAWIKGRWVEKKGQRRRCYYTMTPKGEDVLVQERRQWTAFTTMVNQVIGVSHA